MPLPLADTEDVVLETSPELGLGRLDDQNSVSPLSRPTLSQAAHAKRKRKRTKIPNARDDKSPSPPLRRSGAAQLSPPITLNSSRNASKDAVTNKNGDDDRPLQHAEGTRVPGSRKGLVTKRKPKRPVVGLV